ncbi:MAG: 4'-phosphopantetheinyl transferase superfamily protein [Bacteroidia bacterium]|jgi:phosphopantetheinyl transferase|nr:4'-phosphopantetheinyl transferase superfamily protein [Bacteroidia bacterium]
MPLLLHKHLGIQQLGIWETKEPESELLEQWPDIEAGKIIPDTLTHPHRRAQWLASRVLLHHIHPNEKVIYDAHGKPWLSVTGRHISFSHTGNFIALLSSPEACGVDIEMISPKIERIARKFLKPAELDAALAGVNPETLYVYWCAKEALYKVHGQKGVSLKDNITVSPFTYLENGGTLTAVLSHENITFEKTIRYIRHNTYMMAYTMPAAECDTNS